MVDLSRIKANVAKMVNMGAPESDIDQYISLEGTTVDAVRNFQSPYLRGGEDIRATKMIPQFTKGLYENLPFGKRVVSAIPRANVIQQNMENTPEAQGAFPVLARLVGEAAPDLTMMAPFIGGAGALPKLSSLTKLATGVGAYEGTKKAVEGKPKEIIPAAVGSAAGALALGYAGKGVAKMVKATPEAMEAIKNIPDKFFRGGLSKVEALRIEQEYGASNGSLVDIVKNKLKQTISFADEMYKNAFKNTPESKFIDIKTAIEEAGRRLKRLGLVTERGNMTELGKSEIARDSTYGKLLDFYQSADAISGVGKLQGKALTQKQMIKAMSAERRTLVNKEQFLFLRDKLNSLYKNKPSDMDVSKVADRFYQAGEDSGLKGLQAARKLEREAFYQEEKFLDNRGDLRIASEAKLNRIGTDKPLSKQEMAHIEELQRYVKHPIISDAGKINKLNEAKSLTAKRKEQIKWGAIGAGTTLAGVGGANKIKQFMK